MTFLRALAALLRLPGFRRLFVSRITSQGSDGIFQVALASHVLFDPEQATDARSVAFAFAVVLLPYSLIGPFVGVLLDRWNRRRVLVVSQLLRTAAMLVVAALVTGAGTSPGFFVAVLAVFSLNRFILAGLSASLPHVVTRDRLVSANSVAPTCGTLAYVLGGALGTGLSAVGSDLMVVLVAAAGVAGAAFAASRLPFVGPDTASAGPAIGQVLRSLAMGFAEAVVTLPRRARLLLALVLLTRLPFGLLSMQILLLFRGLFVQRGGTAGFAVAVGSMALGFAAAAFLTPWLLPRLSAVPYAVRLLAVAGVACALLGPVLAPWSVVVLGFVVGIVSQGVKITIDSLMQTHVPDLLLGRAFSAYDVMYNAGLVLAAGLGAALLPASGDAWWPFVALTVLYLGLALGLSPRWRRAGRLDEERPLG